MLVCVKVVSSFNIQRGSLASLSAKFSKSSFPLRNSEGRQTSLFCSKSVRSAAGWCSDGVGEVWQVLWLFWLAFVEEEQRGGGGGVAVLQDAGPPGNQWQRSNQSLCIKPEMSHLSVASNVAGNARGGVCVLCGSCLFSAFNVCYMYMCIMCVCVCVCNVCKKCITAVLSVCFMPPTITKFVLLSL